MQLIHLQDVPKTIAHDDLVRQRFIGPKDLKSPVQTVNFVDLAPGESFTPHDHPDCEECFFVLDGEAEGEVAGKKLKIKKNDFLVMSQGERHVFKNNSKKHFKYFQFRVQV